MFRQSFITLTKWCERQVMYRQLIGKIKHVKSYRKLSQSCTVTAFHMAENRYKSLQFI